MSFSGRKPKNFLFSLQHTLRFPDSGSGTLKNCPNSDFLYILYIFQDHATRSHVVYQVRHVPKCLPEKPSFRPNVSKSVPDFRLLHRKWEERLQRVAHRPTTISFPFHFYENYHRHHCRNIDEYQPYYRQNNAKRQNFYSRTLSGVSRKSYTSST